MAGQRVAGIVLHIDATGSNKQYNALDLVQRLDALFGANGKGEVRAENLIHPRLQDARNRVVPHGHGKHEHIGFIKGLRLLGGIVYGHFLGLGRLVGFIKDGIPCTFVELVGIIRWFFVVEIGIHQLDIWPELDQLAEKGGGELLGN